MNSIFQLADQWTGSTDVGEYVEFLSRGYTIVFHDLDEADELQYPDEWKVSERATWVRVRQANTGMLSITAPRPSQT